MSIAKVGHSRWASLTGPRVDGFFEWKPIKGQRAKQPYAIAMKDGTPFGIAGLWENWKEPTSGEWLRTFVVLPTDANEFPPNDYVRWLSDESDPRDLMRPFPAEPTAGQQAGERRPPFRY